MNIKNCEFCEKEFTFIRNSQKYCCENCRNKAKAKRIAKPPLEKECKICGNKFIAKGKARHSVFCSDKCRNKRHNIIKKCEICGKEFFADKTTKTCSKECTSEYIARNKRVYMICNICGKTYWVHKSRENKSKFCSMECYRESRRTGQKHNCVCSNKNCNNTFYKAPSLQKKHKWNFCSYECMGVVYRKSGAFSGENAPAYVGLYGNRKKKYYGPNWLEQRRKVRERDNYTCQLCGITEEEYGKELSVHHKIPFVIFVNYEEANDLDNLESLCEPCHRIVHSGDNHPSKFREIYNYKVEELKDEDFIF